MAKKAKTLPGPCKEVIEGETEHGGTCTVIYYFDSRYKPVPKERATRSILHEYDEKERSVFRDYFSCEKGVPVIKLGSVTKKERPDEAPDAEETPEAETNQI